MLEGVAHLICMLSARCKEAYRVDLLRSNLLDSAFAVKQKIDHITLSFIMPQHLLASLEQPATGWQTPTQASETASG